MKANLKGSRSDGGIDQDPQPSWIAAGSPVFFLFWRRTAALSPMQVSLCTYQQNRDFSNTLSDQDWR